MRPHVRDARDELVAEGVELNVPNPLLVGRLDAGEGLGGVATAVVVAAPVPEHDLVVGGDQQDSLEGVEGQGGDQSLSAPNLEKDKHD